MKTTAQSAPKLFDHPILRTLTTFAEDQGVQLYLVGGSVRDLLLGRQTADIDLTLASNAIQFAKAFAANIGAIAITLEENPPTARVIVKQDGTSQPAHLSMDFAQFRAASLTDDLRLRDLTINAMAIALKNVGTLTNQGRKQNFFRIIDPCGGKKDLETGILRFPSKQVVIEDPVRLLRIYRFAAQLDFEISEKAIDLVMTYGAMLSDVAGERCRDELMKIFRVKKAYPHLQQMEATGLLTQVVPSLKGTRRAWASLEDFEENPIPVPLQTYRKEINRYLQEEVSIEVDRRSLIKLSLLLDNNVDDSGERLRLSRKAVQFMECLISGGKKLKNTLPQLTQKRINRFLRTYTSDWWGILLYSAASYSIDSAILKQIADTYYEHMLPIYKQGRLLTGDDLIQEFHLKEGKQIGVLLKEIEDRQFDGEIRTREEAFAAVRALIQKHP